jgi:hypothetical protein
MVSGILHPASKGGNAGREQKPSLGRGEHSTIERTDGVRSGDVGISRMSALFYST